MRLGELRNILDKVVSPDGHKIILKQEQMYGGQAYKITNYADLMEALLELKKQTWNTADHAQIDQISTKYEDNKPEQILTNQEYNILVQYINAVNTKLPLFYGILDSMVVPQAPQIINVRLPECEDFSFEKLSDINTRLGKIFKEINVDGDYTFKGFDIGSSWYTILLIGEWTYILFTAALKIAQEYYKMQQEYYKSKEMRLNYEAALVAIAEKNKKPEKISDKDVQAYVQVVLDKKLDITIEETLDKLPVCGNINENRTKLKKTVVSISKELGTGMEFHLSLNPPQYASEEGQVISINYDEIRQIAEEKNAPKQIEEEKVEE